MSKIPKIDKKELKTPDQFQQKGRAFMHILENHRPALIGVAVAIVVACVGYVSYDWWKEKDLNQGWEAFFQANKITDDKKWVELKKVYETQGKNRAAYFAAITVADHNFDEAKKMTLKGQGDPAPLATEALAWYQKALAFGGLEPLEKQLLLVDVGATYELTKKFDEALTEYKKAAEMDAAAKGLALLSVARVYELKKEEPKAVETYQKISTDFVDTEYGKTAKNNLRRLKSPLFKESEKL